MYEGDEDILSPNYMVPHRQTTQGKVNLGIAGWIYTHPDVVLNKEGRKVTCATQMGVEIIVVDE